MCAEIIDLFWHLLNHLPCNLSVYLHSKVQLEKSWRIWECLGIFFILVLVWRGATAHIFSLLMRLLQGLQKILNGKSNEAWRTFGLKWRKITRFLSELFLGIIELLLWIWSKVNFTRKEWKSNGLLNLIKKHNKINLV